MGWGRTTISRQIEISGPRRVPVKVCNCRLIDCGPFVRDEEFGEGSSDV